MSIDIIARALASKGISREEIEDLIKDFVKANEPNTFEEPQTFNEKIVVNGDIIQNGEAYETHAEKIYTKKDTIITRDGAISGLADGEYTGFKARIYNGINDGMLVFDNTGTARVGDEGDLQPLLTREETGNLVDGAVLVWNAGQYKAVGSNEFIKTNMTPKVIETLSAGSIVVSSKVIKEIPLVTGDITITLDEGLDGYCNEWIFIIHQGETVYNINLPNIEWDRGFAPNFSPNTVTEVRLWYKGNTLQGVWL